MLKIIAPAKINLTLEVLGKRTDGFHEIRSVMQTVSLCDVLSFNEADKTRIKCDMPGWTKEESLVSRAVNLLRDATDSTRGVAIDITKKIPLMSGLGGDSSDVAAVLKGLNELWELRLTDERLEEMAGQLGSDVVFFLKGGTALMEGRGEIVKLLPSLIKTWIVVVVPDIPVKVGKTARMYQKLKASHFTDGTMTERLADGIKRGGKCDPAMIFNTFENVAFDDFDMRRVYVEHIVKLGAPHVHLVGSGPALFTLYNNESAAGNLYQRCKDQSMKVFIINTRSSNM